jgi:pyruvate/2-oxoglutarate/acetoin dehydrogenase E1 component
MKYVESLNQALHQLMHNDERVYLIGEDILDPYGGAFKVSKGLSTSFPERVITTPISESGITGFAIGLAMSGMLPIVEIMFGDFLTLCTDQIVNHACKFRWMYNDQVRVPLVIRTPMGGGRGYGATHSQSLESLFMGIPDLKIVAPSHYHQPGDLLINAVLHENDPVLFVENKLLYPQELFVEKSDTPGKSGEFYCDIICNSDASYPTISLSLVPDEKPDICIVCYGRMPSLVVEAAYDVFIENEILVKLLIPSLIKPVPLMDLITVAEECKRVIIVEEGCLTGGWGAEVASQLYEKIFPYLNTPIQRIAALDSPIPSARTMENLIFPTAGKIKKHIYQIMES